MEHILRGKEVAAAIMERNRPIIADLKEKGITPTLAIFRVGEKEADLSYERGAIKRFEQCGIQTVRYTFDENVSVEDFYQKLDEANTKTSIRNSMKPIRIRRSTASWSFGLCRRIASMIRRCAILSHRIKTWMAAVTCL